MTWRTPGARYHLYFLLVSMQIYLLFPLIRWVLKKTEGYHAWLFGVALAYQAWLTVGLHYKVGRQGNGLIAQFLNGAGQGYWIDTYVLYVVAGALAGWHFEQLCAFTRRHLRSGWRVALVAAAGVAAGIGVYLVETEVFGATPNNASAVFQPVVIFEALAFGWALLGAGLLWSDRGAPGRKFAAAGSASSFGIYLAHPLVLQVLLLVAGSHYFGAHGGLTGWLHRLPHSSFEVLILLFIAVPLIYACAWVIASAVRRTPVSLFLTGREWKPKRKFRLGQATDRALDKIEDKHHRAGQADPPPRVRHRARGRRRGGRRGGHRDEDRQRGRPHDEHHGLHDPGGQHDQELHGAHAREEDAARVGADHHGAFRPQLHPGPGDQPGRAHLLRDRGRRGAGLPAGLPGVVERDRLLLLGGAGQRQRRRVHRGAGEAGRPGNARPIYLMGYSNGGRLAYTLACEDPLLFDGTAVVKADPMPWCDISVPQKILQVASTDDTDTP